ncbi:MAG: hypothetical protein L3J88_04450 [Gammaproteobacteria bacterium]|nr:hypothetical protein [Gammaproteobacteria bacterium]MCF6362590.1 hypothetical protein [Gammaproteobacteria bacterium]
MNGTCPQRGMKNAFTGDIGVMHPHRQARHHGDTPIPDKARRSGGYLL